MLIIINLHSTFNPQITPAAVNAFPPGTKPTTAPPPSPSQRLCPIQGGVIQDWGALESLLHYIIYNQLGWVLGAEGNLLIAEPLFMSRSDREKLTQLAFEVFNVEKYCAECQPVLSLFSIGKLNGVTVDIGCEKIDVAPVLEGQVQLGSSQRIAYGGVDIDKHLLDMLLGRNNNNMEGITLDVAKSIKERIINVSHPMATTTSTSTTTTAVVDNSGGGDAMEEEEEDTVTHTLPDGQSITVSRSKEGRELGESTIIHPLGLPLSDIIYATANIITAQGEKEARRVLFENILLCGGGSRTKGLGARVLHDIKQLSQASLAPSLAAIPEYMPVHTQEAAAWMGGAVLAKVAFAGKTQHITKADYQENGPGVVHKVCSL